MGDNLTVCNSSGIVFQDTHCTCQIHVQSHILCQTSCNKAKTHLVFHTHVGFSPVWEAVSVKSPTISSAKPAALSEICLWQLLRCVDMSHCWGTASLQQHWLRQVSPVSAACGPQGGAAARGQDGETVTYQAVTVQNNPSLSPSLCYLLVFRHNPIKLWCLMPPPLLWAKHLKKPQVPSNMTWTTGL